MNGPGGGGVLAVFAVEADGTLGRIFEPAPGAGFSSWERFGFRLISAPAVARNTDGRLELFGARPGGRLGHLWQEVAGEMRGWSSWEELGPPISGDPAVCANADGRLEVFAAGSEGRLGHMWQISPSGVTGWSEWNSFGFALQGAPVVARSARGPLEVFAIGADGCLGHVWQERRVDGATDWAAWGSFGVPIQGVPAVIQNRHGGLEVFAVAAADGCLGHIWQQPDPQGALSWSHWDSFGIPVRSSVAVCQNRRGSVEVFGIGADGSLGHLWQIVAVDGSVSWSRWGSFGAAVQSPPAAGQDSSGELVVVAPGPGGILGLVRQWRAEEEIGWAAWHDVGPEVSGKPIAIAEWRQAPVGATEADSSGLQSAPPVGPVPRLRPHRRLSVRAG